MKKIVIFLLIVLSCQILYGEQHEIIKLIKGFEITKKEIRNYDKSEFYTKNGTKEIKGKYYRYDAEKKDENGDVDSTFSGTEILQNYKEAAIKLNGKILYEDNSVLHFVLETKSNGKIWAKVDATNGWYTIYIIDEQKLNTILHFGLIDSYSIKNMKRDVEMSEELLKESHPIIKLIPGFIVQRKEIKDYEKVEFYDKKGNVLEKKGKHYFYDMAKNDENGERDEGFSGMEILQNYKEAALELGGEILYESSSLLHFYVESKNGIAIWAKVDAAGGWYYLDIVEEKAMTKSLIFDADTLEKELEENGKIVLYGILFDTAKHTLKDHSISQLEQIVKLMRKNKAIKIEVQGHTDNVGDDDYNMKLSNDRAKQVVEFLKMFDIKEDRMKSKGYGESSPIADNDTEEGRKKNRRVELIKIN